MQRGKSNLDPAKEMMCRFDVHKTKPQPEQRGIHALCPSTTVLSEQ